MATLQADVQATGRINIPLVAAGSMLEFYEFQSFAIFTGAISTVFFPSSQPEWLRQMQTFALLSVAFLIRPLSGAFVGWIGDRLGRKTSFLITISAMALPTLAVGLMPGYAKIGLAAPLILLLLRTLQGAASAGEMSGAAVFITESARPGAVGASSGALYGAIHFGYFIAAVVALVINFSLPAAEVRTWGWRIAFVLGGALGLVTLVARRALHESPAFEQLRERRGAQAAPPILQTLRTYRAEVLTVMLLAGYVGVSVAIVYVFAPTWLQGHVAVTPKGWSLILSISYLTLAGASAVWGRVADRLGFRAVISGGAVLIVLIALGFTFAVADQHPGMAAVLAWYVAISLALGSVGSAFAVAASLFPTEVRLTGVGVAYNLGLAVFLGTTPLALPLLTHSFGGLPILGYISAAAALGLIAMARFRTESVRSPEVLTA